MSKIGIYKIGFKEINEVDDNWTQQEEQSERSLNEIYLDGSHWFKSIDQTATDLTEELVIGEEGKYYKLDLPFVVRKKEDIELAKKYEGRPVVVYAVAVDGKRYTIGSKEYPTWLVTSNRYQGLNTREMAMTVSYKNKTSLLR